MHYEPFSLKFPLSLSPEWKTSKNSLAPALGAEAKMVFQHLQVPLIMPWIAVDITELFAKETYEDIELVISEIPHWVMCWYERYQNNKKAQDSMVWIAQKVLKHS